MPTPIQPQPEELEEELFLKLQEEGKVQEVQKKLQEENPRQGQDLMSVLAVRQTFRVKTPTSLRCGRLP